MTRADIVGVQRDLHTSTCRTTQFKVQDICTYNSRTDMSREEGNVYRSTQKEDRNGSYGVLCGYITSRVNNVSSRASRTLFDNDFVAIGSDRSTSREHGHGQSQVTVIQRKRETSWMGSKSEACRRNQAPATCSTALNRSLSSSTWM
jgi:hypothetical protein